MKIWWWWELLFSLFYKHQEDINYNDDRECYQPLHHLMIWWGDDCLFFSPDAPFILAVNWEKTWTGSNDVQKKIRKRKKKRVETDTHQGNQSTNHLPLIWFSLPFVLITGMIHLITWSRLHLMKGRAFTDLNKLLQKAVSHLNLSLSYLEVTIDSFPSSLIWKEEKSDDNHSIHNKRWSQPVTITSELFITPDVW